MTMQLTQQWRSWISDNLARGCDPKSLIADMVRDRFDAAVASEAVFSMAAQHDSSPPTEAPYVYEQPRFSSANVIRTPDRDVRVVMRIERPMIAIVDGLLSDEECDELVRRSATRLQRSTIVDPKRGTNEVIPDRSSDGTYFPVNADDFIARLDRRIAAVMNAPIENGEGLQILRYSTGGEYTPHFDYFPPDDPGSRAHVAVGGQRVASLVMYLNHVEDGGSTIFPKLNLAVGPKKGAAVYFEYCNSRGQVDPLTLHGGSPVRKGEKWIATKWVRERPYAVSA